jgi:hypothetical protein
MDAGCENGTEGGCTLWCAGLTEEPECEPYYQGIFECAEDADFYCNEQGDAIPEGCEGELSLALACAFGTGPNPEFVDPCEDYCARVVEANCPNTESLADCVSGCTLLASDSLACTDEWDAVLDCAETADIICNDQGDAVPDGCQLLIVAYALCALSGGAGGAGGAGG